MNRKAMALILGAIVIVLSLAFAGTAAGQGGSSCEHDPNCIKIDDPGNSGSYTATSEIEVFVIKAGTSEFAFMPPGGDNGCYAVSFSNNNFTVSWNRYGSGPSCKDISHVQIWMKPGTPEVTPTTETPEPTVEITPTTETPEPTVEITPTTETPEPTVEITPTTETPEPTVEITPTTETPEPTVEVTPTTETPEPTVEVTPTTETPEPTVEITPTTQTPEPTITSTFVPTSTPPSTEVPVTTCDNIRVPAGESTLEYRSGEVWHFGATLYGPSGLVLDYRNGAGQYRIVQNGNVVVEFSLGGGECSAQVSTSNLSVVFEQRPCPTCPPLRCESTEATFRYYDAGVGGYRWMAITKDSNVETDGEKLTNGEWTIIVRATQPVAGFPDDGVACSTCIIEWGVAPDGTVFFGFGSTIWDTAVAIGLAEGREWPSYQDITAARRVRNLWAASGQPFGFYSYK